MNSCFKFATYLILVFFLTSFPCACITQIWNNTFQLREKITASSRHPPVSNRFLLSTVVRKQKETKNIQNRNKLCQTREYDSKGIHVDAIYVRVA